MEEESKGLCLYNSRGEPPLPCWLMQRGGGSCLWGLEHCQGSDSELGTQREKNQAEGGREGGRAAEQKAERKSDEKWGSSWWEMSAGKQNSRLENQKPLENKETSGEELGLSKE